MATAQGKEAPMFSVWWKTGSGNFYHEGFESFNQARQKFNSQRAQDGCSVVVMNDTGDVTVFHFPGQASQDSLAQAIRKASTHAMGSFMMGVLGDPAVPKATKITMLGSIGIKVEAASGTTSTVTREDFRREFVKAYPPVMSVPTSTSNSGTNEYQLQSVQFSFNKITEIKGPWSSKTKMKEIRTRIATECGLSLAQCSLKLISRNVDDEQPIGHYKLKPQMIMTVLNRKNGGMALVKSAAVSGRVARDYGVCNSTKPCILQAGEESRYNIRMTCGHVYSRDGLQRKFLKDVTNESMGDGIRQHKGCFPCVASGCNTKWDFMTMVAVSGIEPKLEQAEYMKYSRLASNFSMMDDPLARGCPHCKNWFRRGDNIFQKVIDRKLDCSFQECINSTVTVSANGKTITIQSGQPKFMCWECQRPWIGDADCGYDDCKYFGTGKGSDYKVLQTCDTKDINYCDHVKNVPKIRRCPGCKTLIEHASACKHMTCNAPGCKYEFCFVCLKDWKNADKSKNCTHSIQCTVAARQE
jgi:hypothetical protein